MLVNIKWESDGIVGLGCNGVCAQKDCSRLPSLKRTKPGWWKMPDRASRAGRTWALGCGVPTSSLLGEFPNPAYPRSLCSSQSPSVSRHGPAVFQLWVIAEKQSAPGPVVTGNRNLQLAARHLRDDFVGLIHSPHIQARNACAPGLC